MINGNKAEEKEKREKIYVRSTQTNKLTLGTTHNHVIKFILTCK